MEMNNVAFITSLQDIKNDILIPKYYDPVIDRELQKLTKTHDLVTIEELVQTNVISISTGDEIGKMAYGTGDIPFIRTSDIFNWELKAEVKQGVSQEIYEEYATKQDVKPEDIFLVRDGTYLVGTVCMITKFDTKILYQSHILKFRVKDKTKLSPYLLLAVLSCPIVQKQIKAKQFTADIIDTVGNRINEIVLPFPKDVKQSNMIIQIKMENLIEKLEKTHVRKPSTPILRLFGFTIHSAEIKNDILIPKYYDPEVENILLTMKNSHDLTSIQRLVDNEIITLSTGDEIGKMAYGTGDIPFIRTSDLSNWELKTDPKQGVSEEIYNEYKDKQDVKPEDIFLVRDGTYLVGTSCILTEQDSKILYCGGIYKIRVNKKDVLDPYLLFGLLNTNIVKQQIVDKQFTRDVIDTLGKRILEIVLPIPKNPPLRNQISSQIKKLIEEKQKLRKEQLEIKNFVQTLKL
jgi:hypothetical protein